MITIVVWGFQFMLLTFSISLIKGMHGDLILIIGNSVIAL